MKTDLELLDEIKQFIWDFKNFDNIEYNLEIIRVIEDSKKELSAKKAQKLNKPITILYVAIIECILHDFVIRLVDSTNHFPKSIDRVKRETIKSELKKKNYTFSQLITIMQKYELLGSAESKAYETLQGIHKLRNRLHILNWYKNFDKNEYLVFTDNRLIITRELLYALAVFMLKKYKRP